jgi:hypothetical protein
MLIKLNFSSRKSPVAVFRILADIINNSGVNNIAALRSRATSANYSSDLLSSLVDSSSFIVRSAGYLTSNTVAHIARPNVGASDTAFEFILKQKVMDTSGTYYYISLSNSNTVSYLVTSQIGTTAGDVTSSQWDITTSSTQSTIQGSPLGVGGIVSNAFGAYCGQNGGLFTFWAYVTDTCFMWNCNTSSYNVPGHPTSFTGTTYNLHQQGPHFYSQYTRGDYWNTDANSIIPLVFTNHPNVTGTLIQPYSNLTKGQGEGFMSRFEELSHVQSPQGLNPTNISLQVLTCLNNALSTSITPRSVVTNANTCLGISTIYSDQRNLGGTSTETFASAVQPSTAVTARSYGNVLYLYSNNTYTHAFTNYRFVATDLQSYYGFILYPITFRTPHLNSNGGNITDKSGMYLFNGDYFIGDEITVGGITYSLIPGLMAPSVWTALGYQNAQGSNSRVALAIPKV